MQKLICVDNIFAANGNMDLAKVKRHALVFDQVAITLLESTKELLANSNENRIQKDEFLSEIQLLQEKNIIVDPSHLSAGRKAMAGVHYDKFSNAQKLLDEAALALNSLNKLADSTIVAERWINYNICRQRLETLALQILLQDDFVFPLLDDLSSNNFVKTSKHQTYSLVIDKIPVVSDDVPWEQVFEFRSDSDSRRKFLALRNWINKTSRSNIPAHEINDELEYLLAEYEHHFKIHKMKFERGVFQTIVMGTTDVLENLAKLQFSKVAEQFFRLYQNDVELIEGEAKLPGQEVAYLFKAKQEFER